jgi:XRE family transcriptional regulator, regulator of sulfur utilization
MPRRSGPTRWERDVGERLRRLRQARGLSQSELAKAAGVPVGTLRGWEYGRRTPLLDAAARLADALGCTLDELAGRTARARGKKGKGEG